MLSKQYFGERYIFYIAFKRCVARVNWETRSWILSGFLVGLDAYFLWIFLIMANYTAPVKSEGPLKNILVPPGDGHSSGASNHLN